MSMKLFVISEPGTGINSVGPLNASPQYTSKKIKSKIFIYGLKYLFKLCSRLELLGYAFSITLIIGVSLIPLLYFIETSNAINEMKIEYGNRQAFYEKEVTISVTMFIYGTVYLILTWISSALILILSRKQGYKWKAAYFKAILKRPASYYDIDLNRAQSKNILSDCQNLEDALGDRLLLILGAISLLTGVWILAFISSIELTLICSIVLPCHYYANILLNKTYIKGFKKLMKLYNKAGYKAEENFEHYRTMSAYNCQETRIKEYFECLDPLKKEISSEGIRAGVAWSLNFSAMFAMNGVMLYVATIYILDNTDTWTNNKLALSDVILVFYCFLMEPSLIGIIMSSSKKIVIGVLAARNIYHALENQEKIDGDREIDNENWTIQI